jgi:hypothetical protein
MTELQFRLFKAVVSQRQKSAESVKSRIEEDGYGAALEQEASRRCGEDGNRASVEFILESHPPLISVAALRRGR